MAKAHPTSTLTFLFTDLEASTRHWENAREAMSAALIRHDALLRNAIAAHGGHLFKTMGDAFCIAFGTPHEALATALDGQQALTAENWSAFGPGLSELRVRMAIHHGFAEARGGDYFGPALNRTARLMAAAHGGQILMSLAAQQVVRDYLPKGVMVLDLGEHHLKDLHYSENIWQVVSLDLPHIETPPGAAHARRPGLAERWLRQFPAAIPVPPPTAKPAVQATVKPAPLTAKTAPKVVATRTVKPAAKPAAKAAAKPAAKAVPEPAAAKAVPKAAAPKPAAKPAPKPASAKAGPKAAVAKPASKPGASKPASKPTATKPAPKPAAKPAPKPAAPRPAAPKPAAKPAPKPAAKPAPKPAAPKPAAKPAPKRTPKPPSKPAPKPASKPSVKPKPSFVERIIERLGG